MSSASLRAIADGAAVLEAAPYPFLLLSPELTVIDANAAYLRAAGRTREQIVGRYLFDAFPASPDERGNGSQRTIQASIERAIHTGTPHTIMVDWQRRWSNLRACWMTASATVPRLSRPTLTVANQRHCNCALR